MRYLTVTDTVHFVHPETDEPLERPKAGAPPVNGEPQMEAVPPVSWRQFMVRVILSNKKVFGDLDGIYASGRLRHLVRRAQEEKDGGTPCAVAVENDDLALMKRALKEREQPFEPHTDSQLIPHMDSIMQAADKPPQGVKILRENGDDTPPREPDVCGEPGQPRKKATKA